VAELYEAVHRHGIPHIDSSSRVPHQCNCPAYADWYAWHFDTMSAQLL